MPFDIGAGNCNNWGVAVGRPGWDAYMGQEIG